jgi:hypothetical protein
VVAIDTSHCLDCGAALHGHYCSQCGQRAVPPHPTFRELLIDAWHELTVFDSRLGRTVKVLLRHPAALTHEYLAGRHTRYIRPLRLYLIASVIYFLMTAIAPGTPPRTTTTLPGKEEIKIDFMEPTTLTPEQREKARQSIERAPPLLRPLFLRVLDDGPGVRRNMTEALPKVFFLLVPVFAAIVAIFYWRPFPQHLIFSLHVHAAIFSVMAVSRLANLTKARIVIGIVQFVAAVFVVPYVLLAFRRMYGDPWWRVILKSAGIGVLYLVATAVAMVAAFVWAATF